MEINRSTLEGLRTAFNTLFNDAFGGVAPTYTRVAMTVPSTTRENDYRWMAKLPKMREWLGDRVINNVAQEGFKIVNKDFELTVGVDRNDIADDQIGIYNPLIAEMGRAAAEQPDELVWSLLPSGFTTTTYDGQFFFDTDHPVVDANGVVQSVSNFGGGAGTAWYLLDTSRTVRPLVYQDRQAPQFVALDNPDDPNVFMKKEFLYGVDKRCNAGFGLWQLAYASKQALTVDNYFAARAAMQQMIGENGRLLGIRPTLLVVPPSLEKAAREILTAENINNNTNIARNTADLHVEARLG